MRSRNILRPGRFVAVWVIVKRGTKKMVLLTLTEKMTGKYWEPLKNEAQYFVYQSEEEMIKRAVKGAIQKILSVIMKKGFDPEKLIFERLEGKYECFNSEGNIIYMDLEEAKKAEISDKNNWIGIREHFTLREIPPEILEEAIKTMIEKRLFDKMGIESFASSKMHHFDENLAMELLD